jgi:hypothetical protein
MVQTEHFTAGENPDSQNYTGCSFLPAFFLKKKKKRKERKVV